MSKIKCIIEMDEDEYKRVKNAECSYDGFEKGTFGYYLDIIQKTATPITECDDVVSRQAVNTLVDELARAISDERSFVSRGGDTATIMQDILDLPSVLPKREQGEWIGVNPMVDTLMCSECGENIISEEFKSKYCPNCGAEMR